MKPRCAQRGWRPTLHVLYAQLSRLSGQIRTVCDLGHLVLYLQFARCVFSDLRILEFVICLMCPPEYTRMSTPVPTRLRRGSCCHSVFP